MKDINIAVGALVLVLALGLLVLALGLPIALWQAYCLTIIWGWYAPPSLGPMTMKLAFGLALVVSLLRLKAQGKHDADLSDKIGIAIIGPGLILGFGWIGTLIFG